MMQAWGIRDYQIIGGPSWITTDRFSINAKAETNVPRDQVLLMLRSLIVERFNLKYRGEKRELPAYVLTLPRNELDAHSTHEAVHGRVPPPVCGSYCRSCGRGRDAPADDSVRSAAPGGSAAL